MNIAPFRAYTPEENRRATRDVERARLRGAMIAILDAGGWSALSEALQGEIKSIVAERRVEISRDGWVA